VGEIPDPGPSDYWAAEWAADNARIPQDPTKQLITAKAGLAKARESLRQTEEHYEAIRTRGPYAISDYDLMMGYGVLFNLNLARNHVTAGRSVVHAYEELVARVGGGQQTLDLFAA
jgi:hypothetical protein